MGVLIPDKTAREKTNLILYNHFVQIGVRGTCDYDCGSDLCLATDGWRNQERAQQSAELWRLRVKAVWAKGADLSMGL